MNVSDRIMGGNVRARYDPAYNLGQSVPQEENDNEVVNEVNQVNGNGHADCWAHLSDANEHRRLFQALMNQY
jgi:hypothetical protein